MHVKNVNLPVKLTTLIITRYWPVGRAHAKAPGLKVIVNEREHLSVEWRVCEGRYSTNFHTFFKVYEPNISKYVQISTVYYMPLQPPPIPPLIYKSQIIFLKIYM